MLLFLLALGSIFHFRCTLMNVNRIVVCKFWFCWGFIY